MRKIPLKNYVIISVILVLSIIVVLYLNWFNKINKNYNNKSIISDIVMEVKLSEIDNYIIENPNFIIYLSSKDNNENLLFEKKLKKLIINKDLKQYFIFINLDDINQGSYNEFIEKYFFANRNKYLLKDSIIVINNQEIETIIVKNDQFDINDIKKILKNNEVY